MLCAYLHLRLRLLCSAYRFPPRQGREDPVPCHRLFGLVWLISALSPWRDPGKAQHVMGSRSLRVVDIKVMRYTYSLTADAICFTNK